jgi:ribonuclease P protein component
MRWIKSPDSVCRFCFLVKKKNGNAVYRNRCRRILRPIFFEASTQLKEPIWAMIFVNENSKDMTPERIRDSANKLLSKMEKSLLCS